MGEKDENNNQGEKKKGNGDSKNKEEKTSVTVVLKIDMHCEGCASKIVKYVRGFEGVEKVRSETDANKLTVIGAVDPSKIREKLQQKTKKKVDLISPLPKKENKNNDSKQENKKSDDKKQDKEKKPKEAPVTTAVLKVNLHCQGCIEKIQKAVSKTKGVQEMSIDKQKEVVTVKGTMDAKALAEVLKEKLKRSVEVVPAKKEKEKEKEKKGNGGGGENEEGGKKKKGSGGEGGGGEEVGGHGREEMRMDHQFMVGQPAGHCGYWYGQLGEVHAPQMFSDENPNACSVM